MSLYCSFLIFSSQTVCSSKWQKKYSHALCHRKQFVGGMNSEVEQMIAKEKVGQKPIAAQSSLLHCSNKAAWILLHFYLHHFYFCENAVAYICSLMPWAVISQPGFCQQSAEMSFSDWHFYRDLQSSSMDKWSSRKHWEMHEKEELFLQLVKVLAWCLFK